MSDTRRFDALRANYRIQWDAYQVLAHRNATLLRTGRQPTDEQLADEKRAAAAVALAREELLAAVSRLGY